VAAAKPSLSTAIHAQALRAWLLDEHESMAKLSEVAATDFEAGGGRSVGHVATLGYVDAAGQLVGQLQPVLAEGLAWLGRVDGFNQHQPARKTDDG
jgi:hypothetical protein